MRIPLWGEISIITGIYVGAFLDCLSTIKRTKGYGQGYHVAEQHNEWTPSISTGLGFEIYRVVLGVKYEYGRSKQAYSFRKMESRIGLEASLFF